MVELPAESVNDVFESGDLRPPLAVTGASVALWTPLGRGAVATIKVHGDLSSIILRADHPVPFRAANGQPLAMQRIGRVVFGHWGTQPSEEVVVCRSSDSELEIHCHGGLAAARRIMADWVMLNCEVVDWTDQTRQALGPIAADCQAGLARATTLQTAAILLDQESAWRELLSQVESAEVRRAWAELRAKVSVPWAGGIWADICWNPFALC